MVTKLNSKSVSVEIQKNFKISKGDYVQNYDRFGMVLIHPIYDFSKIAMEIVNQESRFCNFDELGFMIIYPEYDITKFETGDSDVIYNLREIASDESFTFAVKSCKLPQGY